MVAPRLGGGPSLAAAGEELLVKRAHRTQAKRNRDRAKGGGSATATGQRAFGGLPLRGRLIRSRPQARGNETARGNRLKQPPEGGSDGSFHACHCRYERSCQGPRILRQR